MIKNINKTLIIAEAGVNHNGDISLAKELIKTASNIGADIIKFQTFNPERVATNNAEKAPYQKRSCLVDGNQLSMLNKLKLSNKEHQILIDYSRDIGIEFLSTAFDLESLDFLKTLSLARYKIPSGEVTNLPYLKKIASFKKPLILSTGMCDLSDIEKALETLLKNGAKRKDITVLHCTTEYPAPINEVNLNAMKTIREAFHVNVGYSDHTDNIDIPIAAVALGAKIIEKHITLDKSLPGPDHKASINPKDFKKMVFSIRRIELALGSTIKKPSKSELSNIKIVRKSIVASKYIKKGEFFSEKNITVKRPGYGISPMRWDEIIGIKALKDYIPDENIII